MDRLRRVNAMSTATVLRTDVPLGREEGQGRFYRLALLAMDGGAKLELPGLPSVTTITKVLSQNFDDLQFKRGVEGTRALLADGHDLSTMTYEQTYTRLQAARLTGRAILEDRANEGKAVHAFAEAVLRGGDPDALIETLPPDLWGYAKAAMAWIADRLPLTLAIEESVVSLRHLFAGTLDVAWQTGIFDGPTIHNPVVVSDFKSSKPPRDGVPYEPHDAQIAGLRIAWDEAHPNTPSERGTVVYLGEKGRYVELEAKAPPEVFLRLRELWQWREDRGRR